LDHRLEIAHLVALVLRGIVVREEASKEQE
jgi:hypothetical protein